jgi:hypothetical protein
MSIYVSGYAETFTTRLFCWCGLKPFILVEPVVISLSQQYTEPGQSAYPCILTRLYSVSWLTLNVHLDITKTNKWMIPKMEAGQVDLRKLD